MYNLQTTLSGSCQHIHTVEQSVALSLKTLNRLRAGDTKLPALLPTNALQGSDCLVACTPTAQNQPHTK